MPANESLRTRNDKLHGSIEPRKERERKPEDVSIRSAMIISIYSLLPDLLPELASQPHSVQLPGPRETSKASAVGEGEQELEDGLSADNLSTDDLTGSDDQLERPKPEKPGPSSSDNRHQPPKGGGSEEPDEENTQTDTKEITEELPLDQLFEILKNSRRRLTLQYLEDNDGTATLSELAEHIAAIENDTTVQAISSSQRKRVYVGLYQCHLPKMDDTDVIDFDQNRGTIEIGPNADQLQPYLEKPEKRDWSKVYLTLSLAGLGLFFVAQGGASSYGLTPSLVLLVLVFGVLICSGLQFLNSRGGIEI